MAGAGKDGNGSDGSDVGYDVGFDLGSDYPIDFQEDQTAFNPNALMNAAAPFGLVVTVGTVSGGIAAGIRAGLDGKSAAGGAIGGGWAAAAGYGLIIGLGR